MSEPQATAARTAEVELLRDTIGLQRQNIAMREQLVEALERLVTVRDEQIEWLRGEQARLAAEHTERIKAIVRSRFRGDASGRFRALVKAELAARTA